jgi:uncharacterized membrane protein YGL010W
MSISALFLGLVFSSIGLGFFIYGKRQPALVPMLCGAALMIFPYFVSGVFLTLLIGIALMAIPYFVRF